MAREIMPPLLGWEAGSEEWVAERLRNLVEVLSEVYGAEKLVLRASKMAALGALTDAPVAEQLAALQRILLDEALPAETPGREDWPRILATLEERTARILARRDLEERLDTLVSQKLDEHHLTWVRELRQEVLREEAGPESPTTLKAYARLEKMEAVRLGPSALERLRPRELGDLVGQEQPVRALMAKFLSPYPGHILLYGPPGTGKTTAARLALQAARGQSALFGPEAPFVEVDATTLRVDSRDVTDPLLGSVHDPIYQGARREFAMGAIPEPKLGLVTEAHGGVLFIDEIGELDPLLQNRLLKVLEEKRVRFHSSYYDAGDPGIPKYIHKLFQEGAPADFLLVGATTREPWELTPALRSRCTEIHFDALSPRQVETIVEEAARRLEVAIQEGVAQRIAAYTGEGRAATRLLADAFGFAAASGRREEVRLQDLEEVIQAGYMERHVIPRCHGGREVGRTFGLGVYGHTGSLIEIEAAVFAASERGRGTTRFNDTAGSMTRDALFTAKAVLRRLVGADLSDYDVHVNVIGGGLVDGPSAGVALLVALYSAVTGRAVVQDVAMTGEIGLRGEVRAVGGLYPKLFGAARAGIRQVCIPRENREEVVEVGNLEVVPVRRVEEILEMVLSGGATG